MVATVARQLNIPMQQQARFGNFDPAINREIFSTINQKSFAASPLSSVSTMEPLAKSKIYNDIDYYNRSNQNPRSMMDYAEAPIGQARYENSQITWSFNKPQRLLVVNNNSEILRQKERERFNRF